MTTSTTCLRASTPWWHKPAARVTAYLLLAGLIAWVWVYAAPPPNNVAFFPLNGTFQNFNPLHRMRWGQVPGRDFHMYLGLGVNGLMSLALGPGQTVGAALFATRLLCGLLFIGNALVLGVLARLPILTSAVLTVAWVLHASGQGPVTGPDSVSGLLGMFQPGNSVLGVRCSLPFLTAAAGLAAAHTAIGRRVLRQRWSRVLAGGALGGLQLCWSNDYGLSTTAALGILMILGLAPRPRPRQVLLEGMVFTGVATAVAAGCLTLITRGHALAWLHYNLHGVAADQFWYFQGEKLLSLRDVPMQPLMLWMLLTLALLMVHVGRQPVVVATPRALRTPLLAFVLLSCVLSGYLSSTGSVSSHYFAPAKWVATYGALLLARHTWRAWQRGRHRPPGLAGAWRIMVQPQQMYLPKGFWPGALSALGGGAMVACVFILAALAAVPWVRQLQARQDERAHVVGDATWVQAPELDGALPPAFDKMVAMGRELARELHDCPADARLFSTYASGLDVLAGALQPTGFDYIIHALGAEPRAAYVQTLAQRLPPYVTTLRETFTFWETWVRRMHWDFYRVLLANYRPVDQTFYNTLWERTAGGILDSWGPVQCQVDGHDPFESQITLSYPQVRSVPWGMVRWVEVTLRYRTTMRLNRLWNGTLRSLTRVREVRSARSSPFGRLPGDINAFQLPLGGPEGTTWRFLVEAQPGLSAVLRVQALPQGIVHLSVDGCTAEDVVSKARVDDFALRRLRPAQLTVPGWARGIATGSEAGLKVSDASDLRHLEVGQMLQLPASGPRRVTRVETDTVWLDGPPLQPDGDGYPHALRVILHRDVP